MFDSYLRKAVVTFFLLTASTTPYLAHAAYIWISPAELKALPTSGAAWDQIRSIANSNFGKATGGHNDNHDVNTLAQALVAARLDDDALKKKVVENLLSAIGTDDKNCTGSNCNSLSISRNLTAYVIAADVIGFKNFDSS